MAAKWQLVVRRLELNVCGGVRGRYKEEDGEKRREGRGGKRGGEDGKRRKGGIYRLQLISHTHSHKQGRASIDCTRL